MNVCAHTAQGHKNDNYQTYLNMKTVIFQPGKVYESPSCRLADVGFRPALCASVGDSSREGIAITDFEGVWDED